MSLPLAFHTAEEYFEAASQFFLRYRFLCTAPNTDVLLNNLLDQIDHEGVEREDVEREDVDGDGLGRLATRNAFLAEFYTSAREITVSYKEHEKDEELEANGIPDVPLGPKKRHEVLYLAKEIKRCCERAGCSVVVDFGSGLGYLDQRVHETASYQVLGLEADAQHVAAARRRQRRLHARSLAAVRFVQHTVAAHSQHDVQTFLADNFGNQPYCIAGLHSCADLTIDALNIFVESEEARALVVMPCCYHKMRQEGGRFQNFPLSRLLGAALERRSCDVLAGPFLRLAAQPPRARQPPDLLVFNLLARAALQLYAHAHNCKVKRNKRKPVKTKKSVNMIEDYVQSAAHGFSLVGLPAAPPSADSRQLDLRELRGILVEQMNDSSTLIKAGIFIQLQQAMQRVAENLVLFDRLMYLRERGVEDCAYRKVFDETVSPRALALVAFK